MNVAFKVITRTKKSAEMRQDLEMMETVSGSVRTQVRWNSQEDKCAQLEGRSWYELKIKISRSLMTGGC